MSNSIVPQLYRDIISKVMEEARDDFEQFGVDEAVLDDLRITWEKKLYETQVADFSTIDPLAEEYYGEAYDASAAAHASNSTTTTTHAPTAARATANAAPTATAAPAAAPTPAPQPDPPLYAANATYLATLQAAQAQAAAAQAALASGAAPTTTTAAMAAPPTTYAGGFPAPAPQHAMPMYGSFAAAGTRRVAPPGAAAWTHHHAHVAAPVNPNVAPASRGGAGGGVPPPFIPQYDGFDDSDDESDEDVPAASRPRAGAHARAPNPNAAAARAWDPVLDDDEDDEDDDARPAAGAAATRDEDDEDAINSDLDDDDDDDEPLGEGEVENMMLCQYERVNRTKNKWKCVLRDGIVQVDGKDYVFSRITGDFQF
ncbi:transcription factor IIA subunit alpha [Allomyces arbusculus]|nr:transcription factor IIA subunit alpha [Allomyces arbusculus]